MTKQRYIIEKAFALPRVVGALFCATMLVLALFSHQSVASDDDAVNKIASVKTSVERKHQ